MVSSETIREVGLQNEQVHIDTGDIVHVHTRTLISNNVYDFRFTTHYIEERSLIHSQSDT